jgi:hypothetical protein
MLRQSDVDIDCVELFGSGRREVYPEAPAFILSPRKRQLQLEPVTGNGKHVTTS